MATTQWLLGAIVGVALGIGAGARANNGVAIGGSEDEAVPLCKSSQDCGGNASCESGKCKGKTSHRLVDGESCSSSSDCESNDCTNGKCKAKDGKGAAKGTSCEQSRDCKSGMCTDHKCT